MRAYMSDRTARISMRGAYSASGSLVGADCAQGHDAPEAVREAERILADVEPPFNMYRPRGDSPVYKSLRALRLAPRHRAKLALRAALAAFIDAPSPK